MIDFVLFTVAIGMLLTKSNAFFQNYLGIENIKNLS